MTTEHTPVPRPNSTPGYHLTDIPKGEFGELSKLMEELLEAHDAEGQARIMVLVELSDLVGALEGYLARYFPDFTIEDLLDMSSVTRRAFKNGHRKPHE